jgi:hypothetical protein
MHIILLVECFMMEMLKFCNECRALLVELT